MTGAGGQASIARRRRVGGLSRPAVTGSRGQASIELLGLLPLVGLIALVALTMIASHTAGEQAGEAAEAGALVFLQGGEDPRSAAKGALSEEARKRTTITVSGRRIHVRVRPRVALPIPGLADRLAGEAHADAGP
jgi:hypothetical protein